MIAFLVMDTLMIGVFCAIDVVLFYLFFEAILIPMYLIIGIWGRTRRIYAAFKFFLYTLLGSVLFLVAILVIYLHTGTTEIPEIFTRLAANPIDLPLQKLLWIAMFASFAVKVPMWPFHTWLPDAHVEAPTAGSVLLAGRAPEARRLRLPALLAADAARGLGLLRAVHLRALDRGDRLHLAGRADADQHEEADRLFLRGAHGHRDHRRVHAQRAGHRGCASPRCSATASSRPPSSCWSACSTTGCTSSRSTPMAASPRRCRSTPPCSCCS